MTRKKDPPAKGVKLPFKPTGYWNIIGDTVEVTEIGTPDCVGGQAGEAYEPDVDGIAWSSIWWATDCIDKGETIAFTVSNSEADEGTQCVDRKARWLFAPTGDDDDVSISSSPGVCAPVGVPALSDIGLAALFLGLVGLGTVSIRKRLTTD